MKITVGSSLNLGLRSVLRNFKIVLIMWGVNSAFALILTMPVYYILSDNLGQSLLSENFGSSFDFIWYIQLRNIYQTGFQGLLYGFIAVASVYALTRTFFLGGLIAIFNFPEKNHVVDFFYGGVKFWWRFVKIVIISLFFFASAFIINDLLGDLIEWGYLDSEVVIFEVVLRSLRYLILVFLIGSVTLISDYAKVSIAVKDDKRVFRTIFESLVFLKRNFLKVFTVFFIVSSVGLAGLGIYNLTGTSIPQSPFYYLFLSFVIQQMLIIFRLVVRMLFCSTEVLLYKDLSAEYVQPEIKEERVEY